ncbi:hypothetical protein [Altererythrobacter sp. Root672]|uniref:hypothetical protein n=1 Tax=Altererythrobacter sp. Root672 TaxID=1736584 RepID=UPI0006F788E0|nr:hypothetical protein [Altererythrobacter sp. Root672]KRA81393.1 hypothetical protein ASD76_12615 [Altererythrobacter sp. Root672]
MTFADDAEFAAFIGRDHMLGAVTMETVTSALDGFAVSLAPGKDMDWLALAVRRSLAISIRDVSNGPKRTSNADIRSELGRLAGLAGSTWLELFQCDVAAESRLWDHAWHQWNGEGGTDLGGGIVIGEPSDYHRFKVAVAELDWLANFMSEAARTTASQRGPWRLSEEKRLRVERGQYLATIYEAAFGQPVSANNFPTDARIRAQTPFMDFYGRMVTLAFGAPETANLTEVVKAACQLHRQHPAEFAAGVIPGL